MKSFVKKFKRIIELQQLAEKAFVDELKKNRPCLTPSEIQSQVNNWWLDRPGAPYGDGVGRVGDPSRFRTLTDQH